MRVDLYPFPDAEVAKFAAAQSVSSDHAIYDARIDGQARCHVIVSRDPLVGQAGIPDWRWHISVSGEHDVPKWKHLVAIAHEVRPGVCFVVGVPPRSWWMSLHPHVLHLWEVNDPNLTDQWRHEGAVARVGGFNTPT